MKQKVDFTYLKRFMDELVDKGIPGNVAIIYKDGKKVFEYSVGFSGCALAEDEIADYIKNLDMSIFVYDYDYNAPNVEHLVMTHEKMFILLTARH